MRQRYRLLDLERLCWRLGTASLEGVRKNLEVSLAERIARDQMQREPCWTESLAVGSASFLEKLKRWAFSRRETEMVETAESVWALQETPDSYGLKTGSESASNDQKPGQFRSIHL